MVQKSAGDSGVCVLLSGGIDSTACVAFYLDQGFSVNATFVDYRQVSARRELAAAEAIAGHYAIPLIALTWSGFCEKGAGLIQGRNALLLVGALMELPQDVSILALDIHSGTTYQDCTRSFICQMQSVFDIYMQGKVQIGVPFLEWTKSDIWAFCKSRGVPLELTYSCERGLDQPCGKCLSCRDLEVLYAHSQE